MSEDTHCIVVGAGIAGLLAARRLAEAGREAVVLERSGQVGGRMHTCRVGDGVFDDGCQYFAAQDSTFKRLVEEWRTQQIVREWGRGFGGADGRLHPDGQPRYCGANGMADIPEWLAQELDVRLHTRVNAVGIDHGAWKVETGAGDFRGESVILTAPVPKSVELVEAGDTALPDAFRGQLESVDYDPCFAMLVVLDGPTRVPEPGGLRMPTDHIAWIADNHAKGVSPDCHAVTILASPNFSRNYAEEDDDIVSTLLLGTADEWFGSNVVEWKLHRWQYSQPVRVLPDQCLTLNAPGPLVFAGDAFGGLRVEGAALSGLAAAERVAG
jgi:predicted NAD/FAD-dependent oxidoreductase